jgi:ABC-type transporter Mla subunit MlaD
MDDRDIALHTQRVEEALLAASEERADIREAIQAQTAAIGINTDTLGTLIEEVAKLTEAATKEPPSSDLTAQLKRLADGLAANTAALEALAIGLADKT